VTQYNGIPGWILLTHEDNKPTALFVDRNDNVTPLSVVMDERMFSDTVLRAVKLSPSVFVIYDIRYLSGVCLFETMSFEQRTTKLHELLEVFHVPDLCAFLTVEDVPFATPVRGKEYYDSNPGTVGTFLPADE
jgi:hypothetical protein